MPCQDFCGTVPRGGRSHSEVCALSDERCYGERDADGRRTPDTPCWCSPGCRDAGRRLGDEAVHFAPDAVAAPAKPTAVTGTVHLPVDARQCEVTGCDWTVNPLRGGAICESHLFGRSRQDQVPSVPAPVSAPAGEAPAPVAGELTFAEAMGLDPSEVEWTCDTLESHAWSSLALFQHLSMEYLRRCRYRRKPAHRPSLVREMVEKHVDDKANAGVDRRTDLIRLTGGVVKAALNAVRRQMPAWIGAEVIDEHKDCVHGREVTGGSTTIPKTAAPTKER